MRERTRITRIARIYSGIAESILITVMRRGFEHGLSDLTNKALRLGDSWYLWDSCSSLMQTLTLVEGMS